MLVVCNTQSGVLFGLLLLLPYREQIFEYQDVQQQWHLPESINHMKKIVIATVAALFLAVGAIAYVYTLPAGVKAVITYNVTDDGLLTATKIHTSNKNWNYSEETSYLADDDSVRLIQTHVCIAGDGMYKVNHDTGTLRFQSKCEPAWVTLSQAQASPDYVATETFLGYTVVKQSNEMMTTWYSPDLQAVLKYDFGDGKIIEAVNVTTVGVPNVVLPSYAMESYDEYIAILGAQLAEGKITQAQYDAAYNAIPPQFR